MSITFTIGRFQVFIGILSAGKHKGFGPARAIAISFAIKPKKSKRRKPVPFANETQTIIEPEGDHELN